MTVTTSEDDVRRLSVGSGDVQLGIKAEVDDERRDVPPGWARAFDMHSGHHFYAPVDPSFTSPKVQSSWIHPYDLPTFLSSLPADHPANPAHPAAQAYDQRSIAEQATRHDALHSQKKGWLSKALGKVKGDGVSYDEKLHQKNAEENFVRRREALMKGDKTAYGTEQKYAPDPFAFSVPAIPFNRVAETSIKYAFGYQGGYQRKYTPKLGYGQVEEPGSGMSKSTDWFLHGQDSVVAGNTKKMGYGF